jgi:membrane protein DedA with SNARE-associated domain/rhodanese-related sulfurtransferase
MSWSAQADVLQTGGLKPAGLLQPLAQRAPRGCDITVSPVGCCNLLVCWKFALVARICPERVRSTRARVIVATKPAPEKIVTELLAQHGLWLLFAVVLAEQLGLPIPAVPLVMLAGARVADHPLYGVEAMLVAVAASALGDLAWYAAGRLQGHRVLRLLCKISLSPDTCVRQSESTFTRYGIATLVIAKFVPGLSTLAPPLAGALGMKLSAFMLFNTLGAVLWAGAALVLGLLFAAQIDAVLNTLTDMGVYALVLVGVLLALYIAWRWLDRRRALRHLQAERMAPEELLAMLDHGDPVAVVDVRSGLIAEAEPVRIPGALHIELEQIGSQLHRLPRDLPLIVYCACPNDVSAVRAALKLHAAGLKHVRPLRGGIDGWRAAGYRVEAVDSIPS